MKIFRQFSGQKWWLDCSFYERRNCILRNQLKRVTSLNGSRNHISSPIMTLETLCVCMYVCVYLCYLMLGRNFYLIVTKLVKFKIYRFHSSWMTFQLKFASPLKVINSMILIILGLFLYVKKTFIWTLNRDYRFSIKIEDVWAILLKKYSQ